ncbi:DUF1801 domain-containing protein [Nonomuraea jiangxiensis]|uniref:YdhG-like domain-containing protein n=1 Tax=Nonomuraea jiangxiensis TaxID=633440 RepID=A0A1G8QG60_9ACTN|nr:DUF1801 domain-containing protein [Nonomuraea jiangxiensis]SDJ03415.1 hypothetical protein SAMN05421869_108226 [Nonomuraea jiangxiensis]
MTSADVDEFVQTRLAPPHQTIVRVLRELMAEGAPDASEVISRGSPAWKGRAILAIISHSKTHVTFAFARGAEFDDDHGLLEGVGKTTRHVKLKNPDALDHDALRDYIRQAVALDQE